MFTNSCVFQQFMHVHKCACAAELCERGVYYGTETKTLPKGTIQLGKYFI